MKKIVFVSFYDKMCISIRMLSQVAKDNGAESYCMFFKDHKALPIEGFQGVDDAPTDYYTHSHQYLNNGHWIGCGEEVNKATQYEWNILLQRIADIEPDFVAVSARSMSFGLCESLIYQLKPLLLSNTVYVVGGYGPTVEPKKFLEVFDSVCIGEGEEFIKALILDETVPNLCVLVDDILHVNKLAKPIDINNLLPDWDTKRKWMIEDGLIHKIEDVYDLKTYDLFVSRGCPSKCSYCMAHQWGEFYANYGGECSKIRVRSVDSVIDELVWAKKKYGIVYVRFMDSIFGLGKKWAKDFYKAYKEQITLPFFANLDARHSGKEQIEQLKEAGLQKTVVGIQSLDEYIRLSVMNRNTPDEMLYNFAKCLQDNEIMFQYDIIHWNPFDTEETLEDGLNFLMDMPICEQTIVCQLKFFPQAHITQRFLKEKPEYLDKSVYDYYAWMYVFITKGERYEQFANLVGYNNLFKKNPDLFETMYHALKEKFNYKKIRVKFPIKKGEVVRTLKFEMEDDCNEEGIAYDDRLLLDGKKAARDLNPGELIQWMDFN